MRDIKVPFEARECRTMTGKVIRDKVRVIVGGDEEVFPREGIEDSVKRHLLSHMRYQINIIRAGDEVRVVVKHGSGCAVYRPVSDGDGNTGAFCTSYSGEGFQECCDSVAMHLAQITCDNYNDVPPWLPVSKVSDYQWWCKGQREYQKQAIKD